MNTRPVFKIKFDAAGNSTLSCDEKLNPRQTGQFRAVNAALLDYLKQHPSQGANPYAYSVALDSPFARALFATVGGDFSVDIQPPPISVTVPPPQINIRVRNGHYEAEVNGQQVPVRLTHPKE